MHLGAIEDNVRFDYAAADDVESSARAAATTLDDQVSPRAGWVSHAQQDFHGHFADIFADNAKVAASDGSELATRLRQLAQEVTRLAQEARKEQQRRELARQWEDRMKHRTLGDEIHDFIFGDEPPRGPEAQPIARVDSPPVALREPPAAGTGYSGGGTSSARPDHLRSFADNSDGANSDLKDCLSALRIRVDDFTSHCGWGSLDADDLLTGFTRYVTADENDATWARTLADTFERAGGENAECSLPDSALYAALAAAGVDVVRQDLMIEPAQAYGASPTSGYSMDPVNTSTGNFVEVEVDLAYGGAASSLAFSRTYSSLDARSGLFGPGWSSILEVALTLDDEGARWRMADGREIIFPREGTGWARAVGENYWLSREPAGAIGLVGVGRTSDAADTTPEARAADGREVLVVRDNAGSWWAFSGSGTWLGAGDRPGNTITAIRDESGSITSLTHERGRSIAIEYAGGRVVVVAGSDGRRIEYLYDDAGHLTGVISPAGTRRYDWTQAGLIASVISPAGVVEAANTYDDDGRVTKQLTPFGREVHFTYLPGRITAVADPDGGRANTWIADDKGHLIGVIDSLGNRQSMLYDAAGNLTVARDRAGDTTLHSYDERGRRIRTRTPQRAEFTYGWDDLDRITTVVTDAGSVIGYEYASDADRDPSVIIDALGGRTELTWSNGLLRRIIDPVGVAVSFDYDEFGDLIATTNAAGNTARIVRDHAGRPIQTITPTGAITSFTYDSAGQVASRRDPDGALWRFEHTPAGEVSAIVDPLGARTVMEYGPHGELIRTIDPLGRVVMREFDDLGNVAAARVGEATWSFAHDPLSRLTTITDPAGGEWTRKYGPNGELFASIDPTEVRQTFTTNTHDQTAKLIDRFATSTVRFDAYGRPVQTEAADGSSEITTYDAAGNPVELLDGEGGLTLLGRDLAGRITSITSPSGAVSHFEYDACGRPWRSSDPTGAVTELAYDADSRLISRTLPTGEVERVVYDPVGRVISRSTPGRGVARYGYDKAGRLTYVRDTWLGTRRFRYDAAGQLIQAINGLGGRTSYDYDSRGRMVRITDPAGGVTTRTYNQLDKVTSVTDPLGRTTTATYDAAGRQTSQTDPDGHTTAWTYDAAGLQKSVLLDGREVSAIERDPRRRQVVIADHTRGDGGVVEHGLEFDRRGLLVRRSRGDRSIAWEYDADGARSAFIGADGSRTSYTRDAAGRVVGVDNPGLGHAAFGYDASGRLTSARAGGVDQRWSYSDGYLSEHDRRGPAGVDFTRIERDDSGQIVRLTRPDSVTSYEYDDAAQLTAATTGWSDGRTESSSWAYDTAGRLIGERGPDGSRRYDYDAAGQLVSSHRPGGRVEYAYDGLGRRVRAAGLDGSETEYVWGPLGHLAGVTTHGSDGGCRDQRLWVDALGELASIDDAETWWDTAAPLPSLAGIGGEQVLALPGGVTGIGDTWTEPGWRAQRATSASDPWAVGGDGLGARVSDGGLAGAGRPPRPAGVGLTASGGLMVAGLEWLGARTYDPASRGFLSGDPLQPVLGAAAGSNPYAYAGNNPLALADPTGLRPATDADLDAYFGTNESVFSAIGKWWDKNWEYVAAGAAILAGAALMCTGVGGAPGIALMAAAGALSSGGISIATQKYQNGSVDWAKVGVDAAIGGLAGGLGAGAGSVVGKLGGGTLEAVAAGAVDGGVSGGATYMVSPGPHTPTGFLEATGQGAVVAGATAGITHGVTSKIEIPSVTAKLGDLEAVPPSTSSTDLVRVGDFADRRTAFSHYSKHVLGVKLGPNGKMKAIRPDMPEFSSFADYRSAARQLMGGSQPSGSMERTRGSDILRVDPSTGYFGVRANDGTIRTFFHRAVDPVQYFLNSKG